MRPVAVIIGLALVVLALVAWAPATADPHAEAMVGAARRMGLPELTLASELVTLVPAGLLAVAPAEPAPPVALDQAPVLEPPSVAVADAAPPPPAPETAPVEPVTTPTVEPTPSPAVEARPPAGEVPLGKGMWLHQLSHTAGADQVVRQARAVGLTHLYLRLGSSKMGFYGQAELDQLLPVAHAAGLEVIGWDFPYLVDPTADAQRAYQEIAYRTPGGHRIDAFSADIETAAEGVNLTAEGAAAYGARLRELVGPGYPMIATVPRPSPTRWFPFAEATAAFDAIAPMVYWMNRDPVADVTRAIADLAPLGKPLLPVGQAYDGAPEGGPPGKPSKEAVRRFMDAARAHGAAGLSLWVWHHVSPEQWTAVAEAKGWERAGKTLKR